ncbi:hypothetical protein PAL_GLEAN10011250 [Pteropus alecto]|uniref:Uncharacterized protein n=1 Tax=Pteropus alecto TaxID=9402 RepID=L5KQN6_PTEAL|nr:hypothetical protein PAL_GLEAN10011250 [Pteropus alecto]
MPSGPARIAQALGGRGWRQEGTRSPANPPTKPSLKTTDEDWGHLAEVAGVQGPSRWTRLAWDWVPGRASTPSSHVTSGRCCCPVPRLCPLSRRGARCSELHSAVPGGGRRLSGKRFVGAPETGALVERGWFLRGSRLAPTSSGDCGSCYLLFLPGNCCAVRTVWNLLRDV